VSVIGCLLLVIYINDLHPIISTLSVPIMFNIVCKHSVALMYLLVYLYFCLRCSLLSCPITVSLHVSTVYGHHQMHVYLAKLFHCMYISHVNAMLIINYNLESKLLKCYS
jgi:hypothetical protein